MFRLILIFFCSYSLALNPEDADDMGYWYKTDGFESYVEARANCRWSEEISAPDFFGDSFQYTTSNAFNAWWYDAGRSNLRVKECHIPDLDRPGNNWIIRRVGPFNTTGGATDVDEWHLMKWRENISQRWLTGRFMSRVDAEGNPIGSPPLHVHHEHVAYNECLPSYLRARTDILKTNNFNRLMVTHGDQYGMQEDGGIVTNAFKSFPEGYGKRMGPVYTYDSKIGDLRVKGSPEIQWYTEFAYRYTLKKPEKELLHMTRFNVANFFENIRFHLPKDKATIHWHSFRLPTSGEFVTNWVHNHGAERIIVFKGDPKKFDLEKDYAQKNAWTPRAIDDVDTVASELIDSATNAGIDFCEGEIQWESDPYPNVKNDIHLRQFRINCKSWKFEKGDAATIVALFDPRKTEETNLLQHIAFRGEYVASDPNAADLDPELYTHNTGFCGQNPDECVFSMSLGYKVFAVVLNLGNLPPYAPFKAAIGWALLVIIIVLLILVFYFTFKLMLQDVLAKEKDFSLPTKESDIELPFFDSSRTDSETFKRNCS